MSDARPILAVDVTGVLSAQGTGPVPEGWSETWCRVTCRGPALARVRCNPGHGALLLALAAGHDAELTWCSFWENEANEHIAPLAGLPRLPWVPMEGLRPGESYGSAKARSLAAYAGGRPFCLLDDEPDAEAALSGHPVPCHVVLVGALAGLQDCHLRRAGEWLASLREGAAQ